MRKVSGHALFGSARSFCSARRAPKAQGKREEAVEDGESLGRRSEEEERARTGRRRRASQKNADEGTSEPLAPMPCIRTLAWLR